MTKLFENFFVFQSPFLALVSEIPSIQDRLKATLFFQSTPY
jgi:hypothetical protein